MREIKVDRRIKYTKTVLRQSLLELMKERPISKLTVTDLCNRADINRNTFYTHYSSPYDLLSQIEDELYDEIRRSIERSLKTETIPTLLIEICQSIAANGDLCTILLSEYGDKEFLKRIMYLAHDICIAEWTAIFKHADSEQLEMIYTFSVNGSVAIIQDWVQNGMKKSPRDIALFIEKMINYGQRAFWGGRPYFPDTIA